MKKIIAAVFAALICAALGGYILWQYHTAAGLGVGAFFVMLALAIAFPTPLNAGVVVVKTNIGLLIPFIVDLLRNRGQNPPPPPAPPAGGA